MSDGKSLRAILQEDAGWLERAGTPQPKGKFASAAEVAQSAAEEGVAYWLRGKNARLFCVGDLERHCIGVQGQKREERGRRTRTER